MAAIRLTLIPQSVDSTASQDAATPGHCRRGRTTSPPGRKHGRGETSQPREPSRSRPLRRAEARAFRSLHPRFHREASMYRTVLVPLDGTSFGEQALPPALAIARRAGASLRVLHVHVPGGGEARLSQERAYLDGLRQRLADSGVSVEA